MRMAHELLDGWWTLTDLNTMDSLTPEFAQYWLAGQGEAASEAKGSGHRDDSPSAVQREAFEALADRVVAARSIL
jgi:hypothetical protein